MKPGRFKPRNTRMPARGKGGLRERKPTKRKGRTPAERTRIYGPDERQDWMRGHPCLGCARIGTEDRPHHLHHVKSGGMGYKGGAELLVPLCFLCHQFVHQQGVRRFEAAYADMLCGRPLRSWAETYAHAWELWSGLTPIGDVVPGVVAGLTGDAG